MLFKNQHINILLSFALISYNQICIDSSHVKIYQTMITWKVFFLFGLERRKTSSMGLLPDMLKCGLRMRRECRERFPPHRLQRKPQVNEPGMHPGTCVTHVLGCMPRSPTRGGGENVPGIPSACATRNFAYLVRGLYWYGSMGLPIFTHKVRFICCFSNAWQREFQTTIPYPLIKAILHMWKMEV